MFLESISPSLIATQGTDIRGAIDLAMKSFTPNEGVGRAIVLITDGENHEGGAVELRKLLLKRCPCLCSGGRFSRRISYSSGRNERIPA